VEDVVDVSGGGVELVDEVVGTGDDYYIALSA